MDSSKEDEVLEEGVQIATAGADAQEAAAEMEGENDVAMEMGDRILILGGRYNNTRGRIYYLDDELMRIMPDGVSDRLIDIPIIDGEIEEDLQVEGIEILKKSKIASFTEQNDLRVGQTAETFTASGDQVGTFTVSAVDAEKDTATLTDNTGAVLDLEFSFQGIPKDAPFAVLRVQERPKPVLEEGEEPEGVAVAAEEAEGLEFELLEELEVPVFDVIQEVPSSQRIYPDLTQKNDMLGDLIKRLDPVQQKNLRRIKVLRRLVENMVQLRNDISIYTPTGKANVREVAIETLADLLEKTQFPLARQVLAVAKSLYLDHSEDGLVARKEGGTYDPIDVPDPYVQINYLQDSIQDGIEYLNAQMSIGTRDEVGGIQTSRSIPRWYRVWQGYFHEYYKTISPFTQGEMRSTKADKDVFRAMVPVSEDEEPQLSGLPLLGANSKKSIIGASDIGKVFMSYVRTIGPRMARYGDKHSLHLVEDSDEAEIYAYLLFPLFYIRDLGVQRSGLFVLDVANGASAPKTMKMILQESEGVSDIPTSTGIIAVRPDGSTLGNILLADWLKGQTIYGGGIGDLLPVLKSFGLMNAEFTPEQKAVLDSKVQSYYAAVKAMILELRSDQEKTEKVEEGLPAATATMTANATATETETNTNLNDLFDTIVSEPILQNAIEEFQKRFPSYSNSATAKFIALYREYADLLTSVISGIPQTIAVERNRVVRDQFLRALHDALAYQKKLASAGDAPTPNHCPHVESLDNIRKIKNDDDRMKILVKFLNDFRGDKRDHWIWCSICNQHLLCEHEFLGVQEFLHPKEKDVLHKEVLLTFSGGEFQGKYMCKNCGQPISSLEFDTHLEYDDEGRPMMGRSVLVDEDALMDEELAKALSVENEEKVKIDFKSEDRNLIYKTISELAALLGIYPEKDSYEKMVYRVQSALATKPDKKRYSELQKKKQEDDARRGVKSASTMDFTIFINRVLVSLCAGALLIDVQTHIPDYTIRYILEGCKRPEFVGFPRDTDNERVGIEYMSCAISTLCTKGASSKAGSESPWELTKYNAFRSDADRLKIISAFVEKETKDLAAIPDVQQDIATKKQYMTDTFGAEAQLTRPKDSIPSGFTPEPIIIAKNLDAAVEEPIINAAADPRQKARGWILESHKRARLHGKYFPGNPFSESSCCYTSLSNPGDFWKKELSDIGPKEPPRGPRGSVLFVHMEPRPMEDLFGKTDASIMYKLFIRVCFRGPRVGLQHEPGYNLKCPWCDFQFPEDPRLPPPVPRFAKDGGTQKRYDEEYKTAIEEKEQSEVSALATQGVDVSQENFEELLVEMNRRFLVEPVPVPMIPSGIENLRGLLTLNPEPFEGFSNLINQTILQIMALPPDADKAQKALAYGGLSEQASTFEAAVEKRVGEKRYEAFARLLETSPQSLGETLRSYFLVPLQRALSGFDVRRAMKVQKSYDLGSETIQDVEGFLLNHTELIPKLSTLIQDTSFLRSKIKELISRLSILVPLFTKVLRSTIIPAGDVGFQYIQKAIVAGIFAEFMDSNHIPPEDEGDVSAPERSITEQATLPIQVFLSCLKKVSEEGLNFTSEQIRIIIADRNEKEKTKIISDIDGLDKEGKRLELLQKSLGLGRWAVGGTKVIWQYDEDQYVREKIERAAAGIVDFPMQADMEDYGPGGEGGYDVVQENEDNA